MLNWDFKFTEFYFNWIVYLEFNLEVFHTNIYSYLATSIKVFNFYTYYLKNLIYNGI